MDQINKKSIKRASKSIKCLSFNLKFYKDVQNSGITSEKVFEMEKDYLINTMKTFKSPEAIENDFRWLITIGILRREVDGQGLTSKVRLTPFGRQVIEKSPELANQKAFILERIDQCIFRKFRSQ